MSARTKSTFIKHTPRLQSSVFVRVSSAGRLEVDGRKLFSDPKVKLNVERLRSIPVVSK